MRIMFVCLGNICRSPMAEFVFRDMVKKAGRESEFVIASAATSDEEEGNPVYPPAARLLREKGIDCSRKRAARLLPSDGEKYDYFVCMDESNLRNEKRILGSEYAHKCVKLLSFAGSDADVADPWYTGDFETCYRDICRGLRAMLEKLRK